MVLVLVLASDCARSRTGCSVLFSSICLLGGCARLNGTIELLVLQTDTGTVNIFHDKLSLLTQYKNGLHISA